VQPNQPNTLSDTSSSAAPRLIRFGGRILFLSAVPERVTQQLAGADLTLEEALPLRDDISTDEITPVTVMMTYDERLGRYPYVGFRAGDVRPIAMDTIKNGGFGVTVAGARYGKGSSRESSPIAEKAAGIRLVIARSFERIYRQNCDNLGIFTSTDFSLIDRVRAGVAIDIEELLEGRDGLTQNVLRAGGLLNYSKQQARFAVYAGPMPARPLTLVEKIIARNLAGDAPLPEAGEGIFLRADWRFSHDYFTGMTAHLMHEAFGDNPTLERPEQIIAFQDHLILAPQSHPHITQNLLAGVNDLVSAHRRFVNKYPILSHGALPDATGADGICHALMAEKYALPGQVVVGTDSHTPHSGALGCLAFGAGATDVANAWITGFIRCKVPDILRIEVSGRLRHGVAAKDVVLYLLQTDYVKQGKAIGAVFEYTGDAVGAMSIDERATLTNMVAELGGFTGIVAPDEKTVAFLKERRGIDVQLEDWMHSDAGAQYRHTIKIDADALSPMVARPGDPGNGIALDELEQRVAVDIAYGGSCTAGKREDFDAYHEVLQWALESGRTVAPGTRLYLQFGTLAVRAYCEERGYLDTFRDMNVEIIMPGCGACANCGPGSSISADQVTVSAINRNFPGRSGPGQVWLASPHTVAASAIAGHLTSFDDLRTSNQTIAA
jgi:3-isopropylmalate/(R)-2-methylmalate dehydratase large subunit